MASAGAIEGVAGAIEGVAGASEEVVVANVEVARASEEVSGASGEAKGFLVRVPSCNLDGSFARIQCVQPRGVCWCASPDGKEMDGTRVNGQPSCPSGLHFVVNI